MPLASTTALYTALYITDEKPSVNELGGHRHIEPIFFLDAIKKHDTKYILCKTKYEYYNLTVGEIIYRHCSCCSIQFINS